MKKLIFLPWLFIFSVAIKAQFKPDSTSISKTPAKSGLSYESLTQLFQTTISTGSSGGYDFKSTLFGIKSFFTNDSLNASGAYLGNRVARNLEFGLGLHKGKNGNLGLLLANVKYALVNNRDKSEYNFSKIDYALGDDIHLMLVARYSARDAYLKSIDTDAVKNRELEAADRSFKKSGDIKDYPKEMQYSYNQYLAGHGKDTAKFAKSIQDAYDKVAKEIDKKGLITLSLSPGYDWNNERFDTTGLTIQYLIGFGNYKKPWNLDVKGKGILGHDTSGSKSNLSRTSASVSLGINKTLVCDSKLNPIVELELAYEYNHIFRGKYDQEERNQPKIVNTLRVHITKEISLPLTLKYDLKKPDLFGIFAVSWNLEGGKKN